MTDYSKETREIYHKQHMRIASNKKAMKRFIGMFSKEYFGLEDNYFENKCVLDAGCGDTAKLIIALHNFGATNLHGLELGTNFMDTATKSLRNHRIPLEHVKFVSGSVTEYPMMIIFLILFHVMAYFYI